MGLLAGARARRGSRAAPSRSSMAPMKTTARGMRRSSDARRRESVEHDGSARDGHAEEKVCRRRRRGAPATVTRRRRAPEQEAKSDLDNHPHIVCEHEKRRFASVMSFLCRKDLLKSIDVPGKNKKTQIKVTKEVLRRLLVGMFIRFQHMHSEGKTLEGCFEAINLFVPVQDVIGTPYIEVKLDSLSMQAFKPYTDERGDKDLMRLGWIAEHIILTSETELPADLAQLFELLHTEPIKNKDLIYYHVSLKGLREKVSHFMWMYKRLLYLQKKKPSKFKNILQKIKSAAKKWKSKAKENKFLAKLIFRSPGGKGGYADGEKDLGRFYRNCVEHLLTMSDNEPNSDPKPETQASTAEEGEDELEDYHIAIILTEAFPKFLGDLQKAFHEEDELQRFNTEDPPPLQNI